LRNVNTKTFILLLASARPLDFISSGEVALGEVLRNCNKKEFHHLFPRALLKSRAVDDSAIDALVNICVVPRASNNRISSAKPSDYRNLMPGSSALVQSILSRSLCPESLFGDDYDKFVQDRLQLLVSAANDLAK
jgi:hypothetical protein